MNKRVMGLFGILAVCTIGLTGCNRKKQSERVAVPPPAVQVALPTQRELTEYVYFTGRTEATDFVEVRARVSGFLDKIEFEDGQIVKKGQVLFRIDPRPYELDRDRVRADVEKNTARFQQTERELARFQTLRKTSSASQEELDKRQDDRDSAYGAMLSSKAALDRAQLDLDYATVIAPMDGRVNRSQISAGNLINSQNLLTTIVSINPVYAYFDVDERALLDYQRLYPPAELRGTVKSRKAPVEIGLITDKDYPLKGTVDFAENRVNPMTGSIQLRAVIDRPDGPLMSGLFVRVRAAIGKPRAGLLVPEVAIGADQDIKFLLTVDDQNKVVYRPVELGIQSGPLRMITAGIGPQDRVIIRGIQRARPGAVVAPDLIAVESLFAPATAPAPDAPSSTAPARN